MEIELKTKNGQIITFMNIDYIRKKERDVSIVSSGGKEFEVLGSCEEIKTKIRNSNMREASLIVNI